MDTGPPADEEGSIRNLDLEGFTTDPATLARRHERNQSYFNSLTRMGSQFDCRAYNTGDENRALAQYLVDLGFWDHEVSQVPAGVILPTSQSTRAETSSTHSTVPAVQVQQQEERSVSRFLHQALPKRPPHERTLVPVTMLYLLAEEMNVLMLQVRILRRQYEALAGLRMR